MSDLKAYLLELQDKYAPENKPAYKPSYGYVSVSFHDAFLAEPFLKEFSAFGFKKEYEGLDRVAYFSDTLEKQEGEMLTKIIKGKKDLEFPYQKKETYAVLLNEYNNDISVSFNQGDRSQNIISSINMDLYHNNLLNFERTLLRKDYRERFCNEMIEQIKASFDTSMVKAHFASSDPIHDFVYETYDRSYSIAKESVIDLHSMSLPHMYYLSGFKDYSNQSSRDASELIYTMSNEKGYRAFEVISDGSQKRFEGIARIIPLHDYEDIRKFDSKLDYYQQSNDSEDSIHSHLTSSFCEHRNIRNVITDMICVHSFKKAQIENAFFIHRELEKTEGTHQDFANIVNERFKKTYNLSNLEKDIDFSSKPDSTSQMNKRELPSYKP